ncbi:DUF3383 family protein [Pectinatus haikarae]|uniref:DUF3383 domain-containing protein n=1 Tax=Pectinatus haikarae TaxID=349096 RepID=A0ABT9Y405_9FIRM|nr:DUF3383 family protein [Pectinatus haikarae]MDQ0202479.1 hypothetical protein [Pectinatus haikarae]
MALKSSLPLDPVVNIIVNLSTVSATRRKFNLALLIGDVGSIADFENKRIVTYDSVDSMLQAGFKSSDRLYKAAALIFGQAKIPPLVAIGKISTTAVAGSNTYTITTNGAADTDTVSFNGSTLTAGTDYEVGADSTVTAAAIAAAFNGKTVFSSIYMATAAAAVITITEKTAAGGHTPGTMTCTGTIVIEDGTAISSGTRAETPVETIEACRQADAEWYIANYCAAITNQEILDVVEYIEATKPTSVFAFTTSDAGSLIGETDIFSQLKTKAYRRVIGQYSTTHQDAICAIVGWAMGAMSADTINSSFTLAYKSEVGVDAENADQVFTTNMVNTIKGNYGNVYINRGTYYNVFEEGRVSDGSWFDEIIYLDKYQNDMQLGIMDLFVNNNKIAQTEAGMTQIKNAVKVVCEDAYKVGFIASGTWLGSSLLNLNYGDTLPNGYLIQSEAIADQSQSDRDERNAPPIYVSFKLAGAVHHVTVQVDVNR